MRHFLTTFFSTLILASAAHAHDFKVGDIQIDHPYARATVSKQTAGAVYVTLENKGEANDKLVKAASPIAESVELHNMEMKNNVMKMREVDQIEVNTGSKVVMQPGHGYHIMLKKLTQPLKAGETFPLALYFEKAGKVEVTVKVEANSNPNAVTRHAH